MKQLIIILFFIVFPLSLFAEQTGNLLTNPTFENGNANSWTQSGDGQVISDCCGSSYDYEFGDSGSIEQSFDLTSDTITQQMLNNGITLNSSVQVQNGECAVAGCWGGSGPADTFTIRLQIRDINDNVLSVTTQERTNVTGINGEDFEDSVSFTGTGSNGGNIFISGSDANSPNTLGGPNVDNISVIMTYDPIVLSATQTAIIATAFEEIEEVLTTVSPEELFIYEEFIVEEFIPFEEPEILIEMIEEITFEEIAMEEINTGIVEIFTIAIEEEIIPMEVAYEEPQTIEAFTTEVESFEEATETTETTTEITGGNPSEQNKPIESNANTKEETQVASAEPEESRGTESVSESEVSSTQGGESNSNDEASSETSSSASGEASKENDTSTNPESGNRDDTDTEVSEVASQSIQLEDIEKQVNRTTGNVNERLVQVNLLLAKAMQSPTSIDSYSTINDNIFREQPIIDDGDIDEYIQRSYEESIQIPDGNQKLFSDTMAHYQDKMANAQAEIIRSREHLRRIRGY